MLLFEGDQTLCLALEGAVDMEDNDESSSSASSSPRLSEDADAKDEPVIDKPKDVDKEKTTKKRVQFLPDGILVRIRVIPPRSNKSSSDSDGSASDSSDSDESDSETVTDSEDFSSDRDTPSPAVSTESKNKFATMPPLSYAAKGSYNVSKPSTKNGLLVAKITGINQSASQSQPSGKTKKTKRIGSPKIERGLKKTTKSNDKVDNVKRPDENKTKARKKRVPLKFKEGKISPPPPSTSKPTKTPPAPKSSAKLPQRRLNNTTNVNKTPVTGKRSHASSVSTSVKPLKAPSPSTSPDMSLERVSRAMQSLSMGKLCTFDGFIFPPHHASELHLPELAVTSKSEDFNQPVNGDLPSPRRSLQANFHQQSNQSLSPPSQQIISPSSANRKRRHYAWQMANGSIQNTLNNTPNISQLWDNIPVHSDPNAKLISLNCHKQL